MAMVSPLSAVDQSAEAPVPAGEEQLDVSIVLPVYNEKGHLREEIDRITAAMDASEFSYEIIVVDDGSSDSSSEALREIEGIRFIHFLPTGARARPARPAHGPAGARSSSGPTST